MDVLIKKLTKDLINDYITFFDNTPHSTGLKEHRCYCVCWSSGISDIYDMSTDLKRRTAAISLINNNQIQGYLAYVDDKVVGWCNTNTKKACYKAMAWQMFMTDFPSDDENIKSIYCFTIAKEYQRKGIASKLLERIIKDAKEEGFKYLEGYPNKKFQDIEMDFMGPYTMFKKYGFETYQIINDKIVMRKQLNN